MKNVVILLILLHTPIYNIKYNVWYYFYLSHSLHSLYQKLFELLMTYLITTSNMYDASLTHGHLTKSVNEYTGSTHYEFNNAPVTACWFDWESFNDYHWVWLHFDWDLPLRHYINIGVLKVGC